jgi:hypothetical protein
LTATVGPYLNPARLRSLSHRERQMQYAVAVRGLNVLSIHRVAQLQLPGEGSLGPLRDQYALAFLVFGTTLCRDRQDVPLGGDVHTVRIYAGQV